MDGAVVVVVADIDLAIGALGDVIQILFLPRFRIANSCLSVRTPDRHITTNGSSASLFKAAVRILVVIFLPSRGGFTTFYGKIVSPPDTKDKF